MLDIGFFELFIVVLIGLFVIGPERLPGAIRTCALWLGRIRYTIRETRAEFEKQIGADDIRRELHNEQVMRSLEALKQTKNALSERVNKTIENSITPTDDDSDPPDAYPHDENGRAITETNSQSDSTPVNSNPEDEHSILNQTTDDTPSEPALDNKNESEKPANNNDPVKTQ